MKSAIFAAALALVSSTSALAFDELTCVNPKTGYTVTWIKKFGELIVFDKHEQDLYSQDALELGDSLTLESNPPIVVTSFRYADEASHETFEGAQIVEGHDGTQIVVFAKDEYFEIDGSYRCQ